MRFLSSPRTVDPHSSRLQIIAAGLPRCATSSLEEAFESPTLALAPCMHMAHIAPYVSRLETVFAAMHEPDKIKRQALLHLIFDGYAATADFPGCFFVADLVEMYPDAKIVLNQRSSAQVWERSITSTLKFFASKLYLYLTYWVASDYWHHQIHMAARGYVARLYYPETMLGQPLEPVEKEDKSANQVQGNEIDIYPGSNPDFVFTAETYRRHNAAVRRIAAERKVELLEWEPSMGWTPLCEFLGKSAPSKDTPFPRANDEKTLKFLIKVLIARGLVAWVVVLGIPVLVAWYAYTSGWVGR